MKILPILLFIGFCSCGTNVTTKATTAQSDTITADSVINIDTVLLRSELLEAFLKFGVTDNHSHLIDSIILFEEVPHSDKIVVERQIIVPQTIVDRSIFDKAFFYNGRLIYTAHETNRNSQNDTLFIFDKNRITICTEFNDYFDKDYNIEGGGYTDSSRYSSCEKYCFDFQHRLRLYTSNYPGSYVNKAYTYTRFDKLTIKIITQESDHQDGWTDVTNIKYVKFDSLNNWIERIRLVNGSNSEVVNTDNGEKIIITEYKKKLTDKRIIYYKQ